MLVMVTASAVTFSVCGFLKYARVDRYHQYPAGFNGAKVARRSSGAPTSATEESDE
jgi:hypothetical protein